MDKPRTPTLRRSGNLGGDSTSHLFKESTLQMLSVGHESFCIGVFLVDVFHETGVGSVSHPMVRILQGPAMSRDCGWNFLCHWRWL
uniref:Prolyl endopeptidase-like n=1 Tax=Rhizophora mucronata TaxID=61149 RepID=A0A2P2KI08_RHIMU